MRSKSFVSAKEAMVLFLIVVGVTAGSWGLPRVIVFFQQMENWIGDFRVATLLPDAPPSEEIVIVTITEDTLALFPYRSPINRAFLAGLVAHLQGAGVKAIAIDVLFDTPTTDADDQALQGVLRAARIPVVMSYANAQDGLVPRQVKFFDEYTDNLSVGFANLFKDPQDGTVRHIYPGRCIERVNADLPLDRLKGEWAILDGRRIYVEKMQVDEARRAVRVSYLGDCEASFLALTHKLIEASEDELTREFWPGLIGRIAESIGVEAPTDVVRLDYRGSPGPSKHSFKRFPAHTVTYLPKKWLEDKIVFIGADLTEVDLDLHRTPFAAAVGNHEGQIPGVVIHAHAMSQILEGRSFPEFGEIATILLMLFMALLGVSLAKFEINLWATLLLLGLISVLLWVAGFLVYDRGGPLFPLLMPSAAFLTAAMIGYIYVSGQDRAQKKYIKGAMSRYLPPALVDELVANPELLNLGGERRECTFVFTDVAGFTTISESLPPTTLGHVLNSYMDGMCKIILDHGGTIDKFIGDAVMAIFGAPVHQDDHPQRAVSCAIDLDRFSQDFKDRAKDENNRAVPFGHTRIGVHTGEATVGNFGSEQRQDYTALGDTVNAAARLESLNKQFGTLVSVSGVTAHRTAGITYRPMGSVVVKGKSEPIDISTPVHPDDARSPLVARYNAAYAKMKDGDQTAIEEFRRLCEEFPEDALCKLHYNRIKDGSVSHQWTLTEK